MRVYQQPPKELYCPHWKKPMSRTCPTCVKWVKIRGMNPNTGEEMDGMQCADVAQFFGTLEVSQQVRQGAAATETMRNAVVKAVTTNVLLAEHVHPELKLIEGKQ